MDIKQKVHSRQWSQNIAQGVYARRKQQKRQRRIFYAFGTLLVCCLTAVFSYQDYLLENETDTFQNEVLGYLLLSENYLEEAAIPLSKE